MRSSLYFLILVLIFSCNRLATDIENRKFAAFRQSLDLDESNIDLQESIVYWKGTKLLYTGFHEGTLKFKSGKLIIKDGKITGGHLVVDVNSLKITDIPAHETIAIRNISGHLLEDLSSDQFPTATFDIHSMTYEQYPEFTLHGDLQIKDVKKRVSIVGKTIRSDQNIVIREAEFTFDRFEWKIGEDNSWLEKKLVDAEVELKIRVVVKE